MPLKLYDKREDVPEAQRASAIETKDGKFAAEETLGDGGKAALQAERDAREKAEKEAKAEKKRADDLEKKQKAKDAGVTEEELDKIRTAEELARKPIVDENARLKEENRKLKLTDRVRALAIKHGAMEDERLNDLMNNLSARTDLTSDEKGIVYKDKTGTITTLTDEQFFAAHKKEHAWYYKGSGAAGGGSEGSQGGTGVEGDGAEAARAAGKAAAAEQKKGAGENKLAFT